MNLNKKLKRLFLLEEPKEYQKEGKINLPYEFNLLALKFLNSSHNNSFVS